MRINKKIVTFTIVFLTYLFQYKVHAAESITLAGPIGGTDIGSSLLPPPGNYVSGIGVALKHQEWFDNDGNGSNIKGSVLLGGVGFLHVYDTQLNGGTLASSLFTAYLKTCFGIQKDECVSGFNDVYSDLIMWSKFYPNQDKEPSKTPYGLAVSTGLGLNFPVGSYKSERFLNPGANFFAISPNIGMTYTFDSILPHVLGEATEISGKMFYNHYTENKDTNYLTGPVLSLDYAISQRKNDWQYGITGMTLKQLKDDKVNGHYVSDTKASTLTVGPLVAYNLTIDEKIYNIVFKMPFNVWGENNIKTIGPNLRISTSF